MRKWTWELRPEHAVSVLWSRYRSPVCSYKLSHGDSVPVLCLWPQGVCTLVGFLFVYCWVPDLGLVLTSSGSACRLHQTLCTWCLNNTWLYSLCYLFSYLLGLVVQLPYQWASVKSASPVLAGGCGPHGLSLYYFPGSRIVTSVWLTHREYILILISVWVFVLFWVCIPLSVKATNQFVKRSQPVLNLYVIFSRSPKWLSMYRALFDE